MLPRQFQFQCLLALHHHGSLEAAARACNLSLQGLRDVIKDAERTYGRPLVRLADRFDGFTPLGEIVLTCAHRLAAPTEAQTELPQPENSAEKDLAPLLRRRSVSPKRLGPPGPSRPQLDLMLQVALRAPDHGGLHPWRIIEFGSETRAALADVFEQEKRRRDPLAPPEDLQVAREHATRAPGLLGFVVAPKPRAKVPLREQWLAAGAALCNLLHAAHGLGFGAIMLSGERCHDPTLLSQLGVPPDQFLAGFVSIGRVLRAPPERPPVSPEAVWSRWSPQVHPARHEPQHEAAPRAGDADYGRNGTGPSPADARSR